jgi:hypothetical protein
MARWRRLRFLAGLPASGVEHVLLQQAEEGLRGNVVAGRADAAMEPTTSLLSSSRLEMIYTTADAA